MAVADIAAVRNIGWSVPTSLEWKSDYDVNRKQGIITAYLTVYHIPGTQEPVVDDYQDWVSPGSFTKTLQELATARKSRNLPYLTKNLWQHNPNWLTGGVSALYEDSKGVIYESKMAKGVRLADEVLELAEQKMVGSSFGYFATRANRDATSGIRVIRELLLQEVSQVVFPANEYAPIIGVKDGGIWPRMWALGGLQVTPETELHSFYGDVDATPTPAPAPAPAPAQTLPAVKADMSMGAGAGAGGDTSGDTGTGTSDAANGNGFASLWLTMAPDALMSHYFRMEEALSMSILRIVKDDDCTDKGAAIALTCGQFANAAQTWATAWVAADNAEDAADNGADEDTEDEDNPMVGMGMDDMVRLPLSAGMMAGVMSAARGNYAVTHMATLLCETKQGKTLSADTRKVISDHVDGIMTHAQGMKEFIGQHEDASSSDGTDPTQKQDAGAGKGAPLRSLITEVFGQKTPGNGTSPQASPDPAPSPYSIAALSQSIRAGLRSPT